MTRFTATTIDLSTLSPAAIWTVPSFETIYAARMADLKARLIAAGWPYNVDQLETDPGAYLQQASAFREVLKEQSIIDAQKNVLLAFAQGQFLDRLGDAVGVARMVDPNTGEPELDDRYRMRIQLAPEAYSAAGTPGGYVYAAVSADIRVVDVGLAVLNRGTPYVMVEMTIMSNEGVGVPSDDVIANVYDAIYADDVKLLTDTISIVSAKAVPYEVDATLYCLPGPDPAVVQANAIASLQAAAMAYKRLASGVPQSALISALQVAGVDSVVMTNPGPNGVETSRNSFAYLNVPNILVQKIQAPPPIENQFF